MSSKKTITILVILTTLSGYGLWHGVTGRKTAKKADSPELEKLQALPYAQWTKSDNSSLLGVTRFDKKRSWHGYNLYTDDVNTAFLMDMSGNHLHSWRFGKKKKCEYAYFLPNGEMLGVCMGQGITKVDWDSNLVWNIRFFSHHDIEPLPDGTFWTIRREKNREYNGRRVVFDAIQRLTADGQLLEKWFTFDHLDELQRFHEMTSLDSPSREKSTKIYDYYHLNTVKLLPDNPHAKTDKRFQKGNILICLRNANLMVILDKNTMRVVWGYGPGVLDWPHLPVMLPSGNILVFDNGIHRKWSRILEISPITRKIVWSYGNEKKGFFSPIQGSSQRLPNGNTLICDSTNGHVFEVDFSGSIVWEFWNPEMKEQSRKTIYRFMRIPVESIPDQRLSN